MADKPKEKKKRAKPLSFHGQDAEKVIEAFLKVKPKKAIVVIPEKGTEKDN